MNSNTTDPLSYSYPPDISFIDENQEKIIKALILGLDDEETKNLINDRLMSSRSLDDMTSSLVAGVFTSLTGLPPNSAPLDILLRSQMIAARIVQHYTGHEV